MKTTGLVCAARHLLALCVVAGLLSETSARCATLLVYNNNESGAGSLRQAISDNSALGGGNTIVFSNIVTGTIILTSGELLVSKNLIIVGPGANVLAVSGNNSNRVFHINTNATVSISSLTITNGNSGKFAGGGIYSTRSTLTINNCTLSGNAAYSGGGLCNDDGSGVATVTVTASTVSGNSAVNNGFGGGLCNSCSTGGSTMNMIGSTISGNLAGFGGGIYNYSSPSGYAPLKVTTCTLSGNSAPFGGGGIYNDNGGFGFFNAVLEIGDTILKTGAAGENIYNTDTVTSDGYNLSSDNGSGYLSATNDQINTDPRLGPLQDNGGPTFTHALLSDSPAIDKGKSLGGAIDQRGAPRPYDFANRANASGGDGSDIGAFERALRP